LFAGPGRDDVRGDRAEDRIEGGAGGDICLSAIDHRPGDVVVGGPGHDRAEMDPGDSVHSAEDVVSFLCFGG
jgi:RTX calcium-binding nonapeptide repeat (4 copies)